MLFFLFPQLEKRIALLLIFLTAAVVNTFADVVKTDTQNVQLKNLLNCEMIGNVLKCMRAILPSPEQKIALFSN